MEISQLVKKYDPQNQFQVLKDTYKQIEYAWENEKGFEAIDKKKYNSIVLCGSGGSAISGDLIKNYLLNELNFPLIINRNYNLPAFADENSLVIISSYSGNTEESISCFKEALNVESNIIAISTGGTVKRISDEKDIPFIQIKSGFQPRFALGLGFFTLLKLLQSLDLINNEEQNVKKITNLWKERGEEYSLENNNALNLAKELIGFTPLIYSTEDSSAVGYRFKCQLNENSKVHAFLNVLPEMNHNEIIGWETYTGKNLVAKVITILDDNYHPRIKKRFRILTELIKQNDLDILPLSSSEKNRKVRIMDLIYLCDWISYYLAVLRGFDPSEIDFIIKMKERLG